MSLSRRLLAAALVAIVAHGPVAAQGVHRKECTIPAALVQPSLPLRQLRATLQPGGRLDVLALGSGTLLGPRGNVDGSVPDYMVETLRAEVPGASIRLTLHGARAATAADMLTTLGRELKAHGYQLVIWQTGTVEAVRKSSAVDFRKTLAAGAAVAAAAGADMVLVDVPYSRLLENNADLQPYRAAMEALDGHDGLVVFRRYDLMRYWAEDGQIDLEVTLERERGKAADMLRACLGRALARLLLNARSLDSQ
jgi:hypothetical protein